MRIPKVIGKNNRQYIFVKEYDDFVLYEDMLTMIKECFHKQELGLIEKQERVTNLSPEKVKR